MLKGSHTHTNKSYLGIPALILLEELRFYTHGIKSLKNYAFMASNGRKCEKC